MNCIAFFENSTAWFRVSNPKTRCSAPLMALASASRKVMSTTMASALPAPSIAVNSSSSGVSTWISPSAVTTVIFTARCPSRPSRLEK